jgi:uncharacterized protein
MSHDSTLSRRREPRPRVLLLVAALALFAAPDSMEMLAGFVAGSLRRLQSGCIVVAAVLLAASALLDGRRSPARHRVRLAGGGIAVAAMLGLLTRDARSFSRRSVSFDANGATFAGTTYEPRTRAPRAPAILLIHGSGPVKRDAYDLFARRFAREGFVVLNVDKRGVGGSSGRYYSDDLSGHVIEDRAADAAAALRFLAGRSDVDTARIGIFTMSQGGWVASMLIDGASPARFAVNFSGPAVSSFEEGRWSDWTQENRDHFGMKPPPVPFGELDRRLQTVEPGHFNPRSYLARAVVPSLWLFGEWDSSQPAAASARILDSLAGGGRPITSRTFAQANHGLMIARGPAGRRFPDFAPGVWDSVFAWLGRERLLPGRE